MIRSLWLIALLLLCSAGSTAQDTLLLFHPTTNNIKVISELSGKGLLDVDSYHILGVFHQNESYEYRDARLYLAEEGIRNFSLMEIDLPLEQDRVFSKNACSPLFRKLFQSSRGALFMGGPDIPPALYREKIHLLTRVTDPYRHHLEASYIFHLLGGTQDENHVPWMKADSAYLISGICLGMQTLNVATGGSLIQDIPTEVYGLREAEDILGMPADRQHRNYSGMVRMGCGSPTSYHFHRIRMSGDSWLASLCELTEDDYPRVLSSHHQALQELGLHMKVAARSMDGEIVEALVHEEFPHVFGVQFHPEKTALYDPEIVHIRTCGEEISFYEEINGNCSYDFHEAYWQKIGTILHMNRRTGK